MNSIYLNTKAASGGDGSINSPYNDISSLNTITDVSNVYFARGCVFKGQLTLSMSFSSNTGNPCEISAYGIGADPILSPTGLSNSVHTISNLMNASVSNLIFMETITKTSPVAGRRLLRVTLDTDGTESNVLFNNITFLGTDIFSASEGFGLQITVNDVSSKKTYNNVKVKNLKMSQFGNGLQMLGNSYQDDPINGSWETDHSRSKNWRVENSRFLNIIANDCLLCYTDSDTIDKTSSEYAKTSGVFNTYCIKEGLIDVAASVPCWLWQCWNTVIDYTVVSGTNGENGDHEGFDIDTGCSNCVIRRSVAYNCANGFALVIGEYKQIPDRMTTTPTDPYTFFITNKNGNNGNVIEDCMAYNCGKAKELWNFNDQRLLVFTGVQQGTVVKNLVCIDTVSPIVSITDLWGNVNSTGYTPSASIVQCNDGYYSALIASNIPTVATIQDTVFYYLTANSKRVFYNTSNNGGRCKVKLDNVNIFSSYLGSNSSTLNPTATTANGMTIISVVNEDPLIENLTIDSPSTILEASSIISSPSATISTSIWCDLS